MSQQQISAVEQRFRKIIHQLTESEFNNPELLINKAKSFKESDAALAFRFLQRVRNIAPDNSELQKLWPSYSKAAQQANPAAMKASSRPSLVRQLSLKQIVKRGPVKALQRLKALPSSYRSPFFVVVLLPLLVFSLYQVIWASSRYESQSQVVVKQPNASSLMDPAMAFLSGMGVSATGSDSELVIKYIYSNDMLNYLDKELNLVAHYSDTSVDFFSRLHFWSSKEDVLEYYKDRVSVELDSISSVMSIRAQGFTSEFTQQLNHAIVKRAEWYINSVGHDMAKAQLAFMQKEHQGLQNKLETAKSNLLQFQERYNLLDPTAEGAAFQQITYGIESQISVKEAELKNLQSFMSEQAPQVLAKKGELEALYGQLKIERSRLSSISNKGGETTQIDVEQLSVGEIMARYSDYKVAMELAMQAYTASLVSLEKSRIEAYRKLQYLVTVEAATMPEDAKYPRVTYNVFLFAGVLLMLFGVGKIITATVRELK